MRAVIAILLASLVAACDALTSEPAGAEARGLLLSVEASPAEAAPGDTVRIVARLRNQNPREVRLRFGSGCQILPYVEDAAGQVVEPQGGGWFCTAALTSIRLGAGQTETRSFYWTGQRVVGQEPGTFLPIREPLPAGEYRVHVTLGDAEMDGRRISLRTPAIPLTLR
jgi:hypothetical protein